MVVSVRKFSALMGKCVASEDVTDSNSTSNVSSHHILKLISSAEYKAMANTFRIVTIGTKKIGPIQQLIQVQN